MFCLVFFAQLGTKHPFEISLGYAITPLKMNITTSTPTLLFLRDTVKRNLGSVLVGQSANSTSTFHLIFPFVITGERILALVEGAIQFSFHFFHYFSACLLPFDAILVCTVLVFVS
jgi:hypothetical protein